MIDGSIDLFVDIYLFIGSSNLFIDLFIDTELIDLLLFIYLLTEYWMRNFKIEQPVEFALHPTSSFFELILSGKEGFS